MTGKRVRAQVVTQDGVKQIDGEITTDHPASSYGQPVLVDMHGNTYNPWYILQVEEAET